MALPTSFDENPAAPGHAPAEHNRTDREACSACLSEVREAYPPYTGIVTALPDGLLFCDSLRSGLAELTLFALAWLFAEWGIRRQMRRITTMVRALGSGDLAAPIPTPYPRGELGGLMAMLNSTAASLERPLAAIRPDLPVLVVSGYTPDELPALARRLSVRELVRKQNVLKELAPAIARALGPGIVRSMQVASSG